MRGPGLLCPMLTTSTRGLALQEQSPSTDGYFLTSLLLYLPLHGSLCFLYGTFSGAWDTLPRLRPSTGQGGDPLHPTFVKVDAAARQQHSETAMDGTTV